MKTDHRLIWANFNIHALSQLFVEQPLATVTPSSLLVHLNFGIYYFFFKVFQVPVQLKSEEVQALAGSHKSAHILVLKPLQGWRDRILRVTDLLKNKSKVYSTD